VELTKRRLQICKFIAQFAAEKGYAPTIREIGRGVGIASTAAVQYQILALERTGALRRHEGYSRTIVLTLGLFGAPRRKAPSRKNDFTGVACHAE